MNKTALSLLAIALLIGCAESHTETKVDSQSTLSDDDAQTLDQPPNQTDIVGAHATPIDAEKLLATTLEKAKAENKRVMVHLGAPG